MTAQDWPVRDARLHAWVDDELSPAERSEVDQWMREHPADAERMHRWMDDAEAIRRKLEPILDEDVPVRLQQIVWNRTPIAVSMRWQRFAAAAAVFIVGGVVGGLIGWTAKPAGAVYAQDASPDSAGWVQRAVVAHRVYVPEVRHPVEVNVSDKGAADRIAQEAQLARWLTTRVDVPVRLFDLRAEGFELVGGRLLPDASGPSAQLMYQNTGGQRITVYLRKSSGGLLPGKDSPFAFQRRGDLAMFYWPEGDAGYAIVGALPRERLQALAEAIHKQCDSSGAAPRS